MKLGEPLARQGWKGGDDYDRHFCVKCNEPGYEEVEDDDGTLIWLCEDHYWEWSGLSPCCGAEPDPMFPNDTICSNCKEHF